MASWTQLTKSCNYFSTELESISFWSENKFMVVSYDTDRNSNSAVKITWYLYWNWANTTINWFLPPLNTTLILTCNPAKAGDACKARKRNTSFHDMHLKNGYFLRLTYVCVGKSGDHCSPLLYQQWCDLHFNQLYIKSYNRENAWTMCPYVI